MIKWTLEKRHISDLTPHPHNPRQLSKHDAEHLQKSLSKFGVIDKIVINTDNQVIGGHQRINTLKEMGITEVETWVPERRLSSEESKELCIRLNRNLGEFNWEILANEFETEDLLHWGFSENDLDWKLPDESEELDPILKKKKTQTCPSCGHEF